jgi:signal transduction histidine kinase
MDRVPGEEHMGGSPFERLRQGVRRNPLRTRLGKKLLGWFLLFSLVPLVGSNMLGYLESRGIIERLIQRQLAATAAMQAVHIREQLERLTIDFEMVAAANESFALGAAAAGASTLPVGSEGPTSEELETQLRLKLDETWEFDALYVRSRDGRVIASAGVLPDDAAALSSAVPTASRFDLLEAYARSGRPLFRLSIPLRDTNRDLVGSFEAIMGLRGLGGLLEIPVHMAGSIESFIVDESGLPIFISHIHSGESYGVPLDLSLMGDDVGAFARYIDRQGTEVFGVTAPIEGLGWRYIAEFPVSDALGPLRFLRRVSIIFGSVFAFLLTITAWFVAGGIVAPVRRLVGAARRIGHGDLDVRVENQGSDEIGELGRAFNEMTGDLAEARARLEELHAREIERAQQLATVGELASGVAHEIKNPVVGSSGGLDLVRRRIGEDEAVAPTMDEMSHQLSRIEVAVRDLLAFARPPVPELAPADGNEIAKRATRLVEPAAERAGVTVSLELDPSLPYLRADTELIRQALVNLLMNAVQATAGGGQVTLSTSCTSNEIHFRVADTGVGIPPEGQEEIFKPFFTTRHAGSGLGLSITRKIAERHGGGVDLESSPGQGSTFTLRIPRDESGTRVSEPTGQSAAKFAAHGDVR